METAFQALLIIVSTILTVVVLMQNRGTNAGLGGGFGIQGSAYRTRRGIERYLFRGTVVLATLFIVVALISARLHSVQ